MNLSFKEWFLIEAKRKLAVHPGMKQWVKSVEGLEKELETLKSILKTKKINAKDDKDKDITKKIGVLDKKIDTAKTKDKPEEKPVPVNPYKKIVEKPEEPSNKPTKVEKPEEEKDKKIVKKNS